MKRIKDTVLIMLVLSMIMGCTQSNDKNNEVSNDIAYFTKDTKVYDVINNSSFKNFGRLIFPVNRTIDENMTLEESGDLYIWYNYINPDKTVEIVNYLKEQTDSGNQIFYNIYTEEEK